MIEKYEVHQVLSGQKDIQTADYNQEDYYEQECEAAWEECMGFWGGELELSRDRVILATSHRRRTQQTLSVTILRIESIKRCVITALPTIREDQRRQYAYELRSMGL